MVIGAGVVGLALARRMVRAGFETIVLESQGAIGTGTSSRNSEVIHAGIYYPTGSLKARLCVQGRPMLYEYCARHGVETRRCGKLIVATAQEQVGELKAIISRATANGVGDLRRLWARLPVRSSSMSSTTLRNGSQNASMSSTSFCGRSWCTPPGRK